MPKQMYHREALQQAFLNMCQQYQAMGEMLKTIGTLLGPYASGQTDLLRDTKVELYSPGESAIMRDAEAAKGMNHGQKFPKPPASGPLTN